jgi:hypothetical protein
VAEALATPNVEAQTIEYLEPLIELPVERVAPDPLPEEFVRVLLTGTRRINLSLLERQVTLECWAITDARAEAISSLVYGHMGAWRTDSVWVPEGENAFLSGPYADIDPISKRPRYTMTANVRQAVIHL